MLKEATTVARSNARRFVRFGILLAAIPLVATTCLITAYLAFPGAAISHASHYDTYQDLAGIDWGLDDLQKRRRQFPGMSGGWMSPVSIDSAQRFFVIALPWAKDAGNPSATLACWAVLDAAEEEIIGGLRLPRASDMFWGVPCTSQGEQFAVTKFGTVVWSITSSATLPAWWPARGRWATDGKITRTVYVAFDPYDKTWELVAPEDISETAQLNRWQGRLSQPMLIPGSSDELVAEHQLTQDKFAKPIFQRLVRRSRQDGTVRWEIKPDGFPAPGLRDGLAQIILPACQLDSQMDWCLVVEQTIQAQFMLTPMIWKLDLADGRLSQIEIPLQSTPGSPQVASDGQTVVFMDDGFVNRVWPGGGAAARVKQANELVAWHPDRGLQTLFEYPGPAPLSKFHQVLPGRRVLLIDTGTAHRKLNIRIVPLDGTPPREIYPYSRQGLLRN